MKKQPDLEFQRILKTIRSHFSFLFQRDYQIVSAMFTDALNKDWDVGLAGEYGLIQIYCKEGSVHLLLSSMPLFSKIGLFDLHTLLQLTNGIGGAPIDSESTSDEEEQLRNIAWLLETHFDTLQTMLQRIHLALSFERADEMFMHSSPALLHYMINNPLRRGRKSPRAASA